MVLVELLFLCSLVGWLLYKYGLRNENFFRDRGVKYHKPLPFFGNTFRFFIKQENLLDHVLKICKDFRQEKFFGAFDVVTPTLIIQDPNLAKYLAVKEFDHFTDHQERPTKDIDVLFSQSLFSLEGHKWREMRTTLSPAFTGSKIRLMCSLVVGICEQMVDYLRAEAQDSTHCVHEAMDFFSRVATDIIGTCVFGIKVDSLKDSKNHFFISAKEMFNITSVLLTIKFIAAAACPKLLKFLGITIFDENHRCFLKDLVLNNMKTRLEKNILRPDMINLLLEVQKVTTLDYTNSEHDSAGFATAQDPKLETIAKKTSWTDDEIVAQCFVFFLAGFDTSSTVLTFVAYELSRNPQVQEKLYQEAKGFYDKLEGSPLNYETLQKMKYLDMVISETLRLWPPVPAVDRICTKDFTMEYEQGKIYTFRKGDVIWIPIVDYHFNPEYFPEPEKFDPERFSDENKASINQSTTYLPFGIGPRNCIGSRFALMTVKCIIFYLIVHFHLDLSNKTEVPVVLEGSFAGLKARSGIWINFRPRK